MARITLDENDRLLDDLCRIYLRTPVWFADGSVDPAPVFTPALSAAEQTTLANLRKFARLGGLVITSAAGIISAAAALIAAARSGSAKDAANRAGASASEAADLARPTANGYANESRGAWRRKGS